MFKVQQVESYIAENGLMVISRVLCLGMLAGLSVMDIRCRMVSRSMLVLGSVLVSGECLLFGRDQIGLKLGGLVVGALFVAISKVTREGLGYGDSWLLTILGLYLGVWNFMELLLVAWMSVAAAAMVLIAIHKCRRGVTLPMIPFIMLGYMTVWVSEVLL